MEDMTLEGFKNGYSPVSRNGMRISVAASSSLMVAGDVVPIGQSNDNDYDDDKDGNINSSKAPRSSGSNWRPTLQTADQRSKKHRRILDRQEHHSGSTRTSRSRSKQGAQRSTGNRLANSLERSIGPSGEPV